MTDPMDSVADYYTSTEQSTALQELQKHQSHSHSSKAMLKVIFSRLKPQAQEIIGEKQDWDRAGRSIREHFFNF